MAWNFYDRTMHGYLVDYWGRGETNVDVERRADRMLEAFVDRHQKTIQSYALHLCKNGSDADDLAQATLIKCCEAWDTFRDKGDPALEKAWAMTVCRNTLIDIVRSRNRLSRGGGVNPLELDAPNLQTGEPNRNTVPGPNNTEGTVLNQACLDCIHKVLAYPPAPPPPRAAFEAFRLVWAVGFKKTEIADRLGVSNATITRYSVTVEKIVARVCEESCC